MADAREIIATAIRDARKQELPPDAVAMLVDGRLHGAGYRIICPDELDPVTLEKAAALCLEASVEATNPSLACQADELGAAIRSLLGKEGADG